MQAAQYLGNSKFGLTECQPEPPGEGEVRVDVGYVGICGTDMHIYHGAMDHRVDIPQVIGHEMSGTVAELGDGVEGFEIGEKVVVRPLDYCGECPACDAGHSHVCHNLKFMGIDTPGAFQKSWTVKARTLHKIPADMSLRTAALVEPLSVATHDIARARVTAGEHVVVLGGGPIGQLVAQVAKAEGAHVLVSEVNPVRCQFARDHGVEAINPAEQDLVEFVQSWTDGKGADVVFEVAGAKPTVSIMTEIAKVRGRICIVAIHGDPIEVDLFKFFWRELEMVGARVYEHEDFERAIELLASGAIDVDTFISHEVPIENVSDAFTAIDAQPDGMKSIIRIGS